MNYSTGHIYKIICRVDDTFCYIGSTFNTLRNRLQEHKRNYKTKNGNSCIHKYFDKYGIENFKMILIKDYLVCKDKQRDNKHLVVYETLWINKTKSCINKLLPFNPLKNNRKEYFKEYNEQKKQYRKEKVKCNVCNKEIRRDSLTRHQKTLHK
jgi:hypothetical protein